MTTRKEHLPGFTAVSSLDRSRGHYGAFVSAGGSGFATLLQGAGVVAALVVKQMPRNCLTICGEGQCTMICVPDPF